MERRIAAAVAAENEACAEILEEQAANHEDSLAAFALEYIAAKIRARGKP